MLECLRWEISRLSTTTHPKIVKFYGIYTNEKKEYIYLVLNFCEEGDLRKNLQKEISWLKRWQWALEISQVVAYLHSQGIIHRD